MKTTRIAATIFSFLAFHGVGAAENNLLWTAIPGLSGGAWSLVSIPEGTLAVRHGTLPYPESTYGAVGPAAAWRPSNADVDAPFQSLPLPSLQSSWSWRPEITDVVRAPDNCAYISCSRGIYKFDPMNLESPWVSVWTWSWDTSQDLTVLPNTAGISLKADVPASAFLLGVRVRSNGSKSGLRLIQLQPGTNGLDAAMTTSADEPYKVFYLADHLAWRGVRLCAGPAVPPILFANYNTYTTDGGQTTQQLPSGYSLVRKCTGRDDLWLLRNSYCEGSYGFDGLEISSFDFGGATVLSKLSGENLILSNKNGAFQGTEVAPMSYQELAGSMQDPLATDSTGNPSAITWATQGAPLRVEAYKLTFEFRQRLPNDLEYFIESSTDLRSWAELAHTVGSSAAAWEGSQSLSVSTLASGSVAVICYHYNRSRYFWRLGVRRRLPAP